MSLFSVIYCANIFPGTHYLRLASTMMRKYQSLFSCLNRIECEMRENQSFDLAVCTMQKFRITSLPFPDWAFCWNWKMQILCSCCFYMENIAKIYSLSMQRQLRWLKKSYSIYWREILNFKYSFSKWNINFEWSRGWLKLFINFKIDTAQSSLKRPTFCVLPFYRSFFT